MDFMISVLCGLAALAVVWYALLKALKRAQKVDDFITHKLKLPWLAENLWWFFPWFFLYTVVKLVQTIVHFIDPSLF